MTKAVETDVTQSNPIGEAEMTDGAASASPEPSPDPGAEAAAEVERTIAPLLDRILRGLPVDAKVLRERTHAFFDSHPHPDAYFNVVSGIAISAAIQAVRDRPLTLEYGISEALAWESQHPGARLHKGTPYYFAGMRDILAGNLDDGFLWMHQALVEDQTSSGDPAPDTPAFAFATMNAQKLDQAFGEEVVRYARWVEERLEQYRGSGRGTLTIEDLRQRAIARPGLIEPLFQTVYIVARMLRLENLMVGVARENPFARLLTSSLLSDLCMVIDGAIQVWKPGLWRPVEQAHEYASEVGIKLTKTELQEVNRRGTDDFPATLRALLDGSYRTAGGRAPSDLEQDALLAYVVRNRTAHGVAAEEILEAEFEIVEKRLFFQLFSVIERLLPQHAPTEPMP